MNYQLETLLIRILKKFLYKEFLKFKVNLRMLDTKSLDNRPFLTSVDTNGNASPDKQQIKIKILRIFNISTIAIFGIAVFLFFLSFMFFEKMQLRTSIPFFYWTVLGMAIFTFLGFIEHIIFLFIKKKKVIRHIEFAVISLCVIVFLIYELVIFTIYQQIDHILRNFWEKHGIDESIQKIETSLKCCGYDIVESRCRKRSDVSCSYLISHKYIDQQYPIAFTQMALTLLLFVFLMELLARSLKKKKHHHHHHQDDEKQQRKIPLSPEQL